MLNWIKIWIFRGRFRNVRYIIQIGSPNIITFISILLHVENHKLKLYGFKEDIRWVNKMKFKNRDDYTQIKNIKKFCSKKTHVLI